MRLIPNQRVPELDVPTVDGSRFRLFDQTPRAFTLIVIYRGLHCPICKTYLREVQDQIGALDELGVTSIAVSSDDAERAERSRKDWELDRLRLGFGLPIDVGRSWGLYVSKSISPREPALFLEPGLFLIRPDQTLYASSVQTMPFTRPGIRDIVNATGYITKNSYPARGES